MFMFNFLAEMQICKYCSAKTGYLFFECTVCGDFVHLKCMKSHETPGGLAGDVFFIFTCQECGAGRVEKFERLKMAWVDVVMLVLYNLTVRYSQVCLGEGYFHRDKQIKKFLTNNWSAIFPHMRTKRRSYRQMLAITLKRHPEYFQPAPSKNQNAPIVWYKLARPGMLPNQAYLQRKEKAVMKKKDIEMVESESSTGYDSSSRDGEGSAIATSTLHSISLYSDPDNNMYSRSYVKPSARLSEFLIAGEEESCSQGEETIDIEAVDGDSDAIDFSSASTSGLPISFPPLSVSCEENNVDSCTKEEDSPMSVCGSYDQETCSEEEAPPSKPRLLQPTPGSNTLPWIRSTPFVSSQCRSMTSGEELYTLTNLKKRIEQSELLSVAELRLHRKLAIRRLRRDRGLPVFDIDAYSRGELPRSVVAGRPSAPSRVLDRFVRSTIGTVSSESSSVANNSFYTRLMGHTEQYTCFISPLTHRTLKPFIRRDFSTRPPWLRLLGELQEKVGSPPELRSTGGSIDYCYVRPHHIPAVNSLAEQYFWPGINLSECLQYPDFSCVVLYKKLVVAFAFLVPGPQEAYISFIFTRPEWRRSGIASFMLYHLVQTCMGKDVTLHVSATNPALLLYQKFGFKVEEFIQDFYDKYLPVDSTDCRHALFLRLAR